MKHIGIIAEYNPFHNGHAYQLEQAKQMFPEKKIVVLMSGNYVQRGEPAIYNKYIRTKCALQNRADIVFELPLLYSTASAEHFASAAILAFSKMGCIDTLCFGAESDNLSLLKEIAHILLVEPDTYKTTLQTELKKGLSFPKARMLALCDYMKEPDIAEILLQPNNILAIEYLKALERYHADITPVIIKRVGSDYHDKTLSSAFSSATAIRNNLSVSIADMSSYIPVESIKIIKKNETAKPLFWEDFYSHLQYALWREQEHLEHYLDTSKDIVCHIKELSFYPKTCDLLIRQLSNKNHTTTRIQRVLLNILLNNQTSAMNLAKERHYIHYLRLLGFRKDSSFLLKEIKEHNHLSVINKVADAKNVLSEGVFKQFELELHQNHLYAQVFYNKYGIRIPSEYEHSVIILDEIHTLK